MNNIFSKKLKEAMTLRGIRAVDLCEKAKIHKSALSQYLSGKFVPKQDRLWAISKALKVNEAWLMGYDVPMELNFTTKSEHQPDKTENPPSKDTKVYVYGKIPAGIPLEAIEDIIDTEEITEDMTKGGKEFFALKISGDSMNPNYIDGDIVIFEKISNCENNDDCAVMVNGYDSTFKRIEKKENGIMLKPLNPEYETTFFTNEQIETLPVRVLGIARELRRKKLK